MKLLNNEGRAGRAKHFRQTWEVGDEEKGMLRPYAVAASKFPLLQEPVLTEAELTHLMNPHPEANLIIAPGPLKPL